MSAAFCLPVRLKVTPRISAGVALLYAAPLLFLPAAGAQVAAAALLFAAFALMRELHAQRAGARIAELEARIDGWVAHDAHGGVEKVSVRACADFGNCMFLQVTRGKKCFHLFARAAKQQDGHWHRMRVLRRWSEAHRR